MSWKITELLFSMCLIYRFDLMERHSMSSAGVGHIWYHLCTTMILSLSPVFCVCVCVFPSICNIQFCMVLISFTLVQYDITFPQDHAIQKSNGVNYSWGELLTHLKWMPMNKCFHLSSQDRWSWEIFHKSPQMVSWDKRGSHSLLHFYSFSLYMLFLVPHNFVIIFPNKVVLQLGSNFFIVCFVFKFHILLTLQK